MGKNSVCPPVCPRACVEFKASPLGSEGHPKKSGGQSKGQPKGCGGKVKVFEGQWGLRVSGLAKGGFGPVAGVSEIAGGI